MTDLGRRRIVYSFDHEIRALPGKLFRLRDPEAVILDKKLFQAVPRHQGTEHEDTAYNQPEREPSPADIAEPPLGWRRRSGHRCCARHSMPRPPAAGPESFRRPAIRCPLRA